MNKAERSAIEEAIDLYACKSVMFLVTGMILIMIYAEMSNR